MRPLVIGLFGLLGVVSACASASTTVLDPAPTRPQPTAAPVPTVEPEPSSSEPTAAPVPTVEPEPSSSEPTAAPLPTVEPELPRFEPATGALAAFVGTEFDEAQLPPELRPDPVGGGALLNSESNPVDSDTVAMFWAVRDGHANFLVGQLVGRDGSGVPTWVASSVWVLVFEPSSLVTIGTHVCMAPSDTFDWRNGEFIAVTNQESDVAFEAWTMTIDGPERYESLDQLECERFVG